MKTNNQGSRADRLVIPPRPFGLLDLMIFVIAIALGLAWRRAEAGVGADFVIYGPPSPAFDFYLKVRAYFELAVSFLAMLTLALIGIRLRRPRPPWLSLMRQPGWIACLSATLIMSTYLIKRFVAVTVEKILSYPSSARSLTAYLLHLHHLTFGASAFSAGCAVMVSWSILRLGRRWRSEPGWIDGLGRALGFAWLAIIPIQSAFEIAWPFL